MSEQPKGRIIEFDQLPPTPKRIPLKTLEGLRLTRARNILKILVLNSRAHPSPWMPFPAGDVEHTLTVAIIDLHAAGLVTIATGTDPATDALVGAAMPTDAAQAIYRENEHATN